MNSKIQDRISQANDDLNLGFQSNAAKKRAIDNLRRAYDMIAGTFHKGGIMDILLNMQQYGHALENQDEMYYGVPDLHNWKAKHSSAYIELFPMHVKLIEEMTHIRQAIKDAPIVPKSVPESVEKVNRIQKSIREILELRKKQYANGLDISKQLNGMSVTANVHLVRGHLGTTFVRAFYYLHGEFMPLNMIIAIGERYEEWKKENGIS